MKSWEEFAQEVQPERQPGSPARDDLVDEHLLQPDTIESKREKLTRNLRNKFMAMAMAGFVTLGGALEKSYADQIKIKNREGGKLEFLLEAGMTDAKLASFRAKVEREEPKFKSWIEKCMANVRSEIDRFTNDILNFKIGDNMDLFLETEINLFSNSFLGEFDLDAESVIEKDHRLILYFQKNPQVLKDTQQFIKLNLEKILWGIVFLDDSRASRDQLVVNVMPPKINFVVHDNNELARLHATARPVTADIFVEKAGTQASASSPPFWRTEIDIYSTSFLDFRSGDTSKILYFNVLVHELVHAFHHGGPKSLNEVGSNLRQNLKEGIAQNIAFEIIQYLGSPKKEEIRPAISYINYDDRLVSAAILDGILRTGREPDLLAKWHIGVSGDRELGSGLLDALRGLGLDTAIATEVEDFKSFSIGEHSPSYQMMLGLLTRLEISGVNLSPSFIRDIVAANRCMDDWQSERLDQLLRLGSLAEIIRDNKTRIRELERQLDKVDFKRQPHEN
ncbi:MAG: hypothetical protein AAB799_01640 [Patescibacteria group bacterium]